MTRNLLPFLGVAAALALSAPAVQAQTAAPQQQTTGNADTAHKASRADKHFLTEAIQGDMAEVDMGKLAQQNGHSDGVKQLGKMLEQDHGEHLQKMQQMAQQMGVTPPQQPSAKATKAYDRLSKMSGEKFDRAFARDMVKDHKTDIAKYKKEAKGNGQLAQMAQETLPTLEKHLQAAEQLSSGKQSRR
jgi:putative membrane protein